MKRNRRAWIGLLAAAAIAGLSAALALGGSASASSALVWTSFDLSSQNAVQVVGQPALLADPNNGEQDIATATPSGGIEVWQGDGATGTSVQDMNANSDNPTSSQYDTGDPVMVKDPLNGDLDIFTDSQGSFLEEYDRNSSSDQWNAYNISYIDGQYIDGSPSAAVIGGQIQVAASNNTNLVDFTRSTGNSWSVANVSSDANETIASDASPFTIIDPFYDYIDALTEDSSGDLLQFAYDNGSWNDYDQTVSNRPAITGQPSAISAGSTLYIFAQGTNGDLIEYERTGTDSWSGVDLTTTTSGPGIDSAPSAVVDGSSIDVFAQGAGNHLIEYTDPGSGWSATDLTSADGADEIDGAPAATISATTGNLVVFAASPSGDLVESELAAPAASSTSTATPTPTPTTSTSAPAVTSPTPTTKPGQRPAVKSTMELDFDPTGPRYSRLRYARLGSVKADETIVLACRGTGRKHATGCPFRRRSARGRKAQRRFVARLAGTRFHVGDKLTLTISEPGLRPAVGILTIRKNRQPKVQRG